VTDGTETDRLPRIAVLLGAGASCDAGIPTSIAMTDAILENVAHYPIVHRLLDFIRFTLAADVAARGTGEVVDVERLFAAVELLIDRRDQPWSPFVSTWVQGLESFATDNRSQPVSRDLSGLDKAVESAGNYQPPGRGVSRFNLHGIYAPSKVVGDAIEKALRLSRNPDVGSQLKLARTVMLTSLFEILHITDTDRVAYLSPLVDLAEEQGSLTVATLNYDRSVEILAGERGVGFETGIDRWLARRRLRWEQEQPLRLLKLHGSIDWAIDDRVEAGKLPMAGIKKLDPDKPSDASERPAIVFGEAGKLRAEGPYLELLLAWSQQLEEADVLLAVGYSFRDPHVNEILARWFNAVEGRRVIVLDPSHPTPGPRFVQQLARLNPHIPDDQPQPFSVVSNTAKEGLAVAINIARGTWKPETADAR